MNRSPRPQRVADFLLSRACRKLPEEQAEECFAAWAGELPAILSDPDLSRLRAAWRAVAFAVGQFRTAEDLAARQPDTLDVAQTLALAGALALLAVTSDTEGVVGDIGMAAVGFLAVVGCIALRPKRTRARPHASEPYQRSDTLLLRQARRRRRMPEKDVPCG